MCVTRRFKSQLNETLLKLLKTYRRRKDLTFSCISDVDWASQNATVATSLRMGISMEQSRPSSKATSGLVWMGPFAIGPLRFSIRGRLGIIFRLSIGQTAPPMFIFFTLTLSFTKNVHYFSKKSLINHSQRSLFEYAIIRFCTLMLCHTNCCCNTDFWLVFVQGPQNLQRITNRWIPSPAKWKYEYGFKCDTVQVQMKNGREGTSTKHLKLLSNFSKLYLTNITTVKRFIHVKDSLIPNNFIFRFNINSKKACCCC